MVERLVGLQAQEPPDPYIALWSRIEGFRPAQLSDLIGSRELVRAQLMRSTIHLVSARDCLALHPLTLPVLRAVVRSNFKLRGADAGQVVAAGQALLAERPRTRAELAAELGPRWPGEDPKTLAHVVTFNLPLVQIPPRGLWRRPGQATHALAEQYLGAPLAAEPSIDEVVLRYLRAFGPASSADVRTWSRITGLREVIERLRPDLRVVRDEQGRELLDVPGAPWPDEDTPAPVRFLPTYDNVWLSHAERSRILGGGPSNAPAPTGPWTGALLVDGFVRGLWRYADGELGLTGFAARADDPPGTADEIEAEGARLVDFIES
jgi:Winged helix DNA-binding domain